MNTQQRTIPTSILLAEDDADDRMFFKDALNQIEMLTEVEFANDGLDLMHSLSTVTDPPPPHVIFLDLNMPRKNGFDCLREIRETPSLKNIPVVILSTTSSQEAIDKSYDHGANYYISKPRSFAELVKTIEKVLTFEMWHQPQPPKHKFVVQAK